MLARASSDAGTRLRRSKSTSTVHRHAPTPFEPLNPDIAQQHAIAAATAAFFRSQPQGSNERRAVRNVELSRSKSTASRKSLTSQGSHFPPRALSIRSVPPRKSVLPPVPHCDSTSSAPQSDKFPFYEPTPSSERPPSSRPLSAQPSVSYNDYVRPASQPKSHRQSTASSVTSQQIRKARSMYYASSVQTGSPIARPPAKYLTTPPATATSSTMSNALVAYVPSRGTGRSPLAVPQVPVAIAAGETIDNARDKYMQDFQQRSVKHKPSFFLAPFRKRQDRSNDQTKRLSSILATVPPTDYSFVDDTAVDITVRDLMPPLEMKDRRSFSGSLKRKMKKVFRRPSSKSSSLPVQQIEASRDYFTNPVLLNNDHHGDIPSPSAEMLQSARSRTPSLERGGPHLVRSASRSSSRGSNRSLHSETNMSHLSASRVTSWGTSTSGDTLTQRAIKRLTVIHESKDSIGSTNGRPTSTSIHRKSLPATFTAFKEPMLMESLAEDVATPAIDPKRVFSALLREIDASKSVIASNDQSNRTPGAESDVFESSKTKESHLTARKLRSSASKIQESCAGSEQDSSTAQPGSQVARGGPLKKSSIKSFGQAIKSTIRTVTPGEHRSSPRSDEIFTVQNSSLTPSSEASSSDQTGRTTLLRGFRLIKKKSAALSQDTAAETTRPTAEQVGSRAAREKNRWQTPLNESATPNFPRETDRLYTVVEFAKQHSPNNVEAHEGPTISTQPPSIQLSKPFETPMSPSIYSRNTDGASIFPTDSVLSFASPQEHDRAHQGGSAVILTSQSVRSYVIGTPSPKRPSSTRSSRDWKAWLSHEVSAIGTVSQESLAIDEQYNTPSRRKAGNLTQAIRTSHTGSDHTTVIVRGSFETSTPQAADASSKVWSVERQIDGSSAPQERQTQVTIASGELNGPSEITRKSVSAQTHVLEVEDQPLPMHTTASMVTGEDNSTSTPSSTSSAPQRPLSTPGSARMNDRFPFLDTGKRSSSNNSRRSRQSKSPTSSEGSSLKAAKGTNERQVLYSDLTAPLAASNTVGTSDTAQRMSKISRASKENFAPCSVESSKGFSISPSGSVPRPKSMRPLSSPALHRNLLIMPDRTANVVDDRMSQCISTSGEIVVARPSLRITVRPLSPGKPSRRPQSALDLRNTPSPRPASEVRRSALQSKTSSRLSIRDVALKVGVEASERALNEVQQRDDSFTPGQRMAERFLEERKRATVLERGVRKSTGKLIREDTPAFL